MAKELVENSVDAGATTIGERPDVAAPCQAKMLTVTAAKEVRFRNQGLDSIEVQDNGAGIAPHNYESIALKHYTSKLSSYDDLSELQTFGFRGEALSSLCALSRFTVVTCTQQEAPRAARLEFETSGKLKSTGVVSGQRGTTVIVDDLFRNLPVRRRELERNIKREWGKVINLLNQYACVQTGVKFTVSQQPTKGKRMILFSTKGNPTTRENIINVFGVKTMNALITMDLKLELVPTTGPLNKGKARADGSATQVRVQGHVSRPTHGEGRQTPDRQMFYVNGRPCGLPQFAKVFNEVYRSYNASQSPFIFADIQLDTHLYDVNVSPDKRTILLHDQGQMLDNLRESLIELFETQDVTIPVSQAAGLKQTPFKTPAARRSATPAAAQASHRTGAVESQRTTDPSSPIHQKGLVEEEEETSDDQTDQDDVSEEEGDNEPSSRTKPFRKPVSAQKTATLLSRWLAKESDSKTQHQAASMPDKSPPSSLPATREDNLSETAPCLPSSTDADANPTTSSGEPGSPSPIDEPEPPIPSIAPPSQPPAPRTITLVSPRPFKRATQELATITIGDHTVTSLIGNPAKRARMDDVASPARAAEGTGKGRAKRAAPLPSFGGRLSQLFSASASAGERSVSGIGVVAGEVDEDGSEGMEGIDEEEEEEVDDDGEPVDEGVGEGTDEEMNVDVEEDEDAAVDDEEEGLFVSQSGDKSADEDDDEGEEPSRQTPDLAQTEGAEPYANPDTALGFVEPSPECDHDHATDDDEYVDEDEKKAREEKKVQDMIDAAEAAAEPTEEGEKRSQLFVKGRSKRKDMTLNLAQQIKTSTDDIQKRLAALTNRLPQPHCNPPSTASADGLEAADAEEKLSLKITKSDFYKMRIVGQFNLGFILAVREAATSTTPDDSRAADEDDELFIIDQHASDEKYNFERLQTITTVQSQRLVQPKTLDLTALEEEIILEHLPALERNGFLAQVDTSGAKPVGSRVQLLSLPLSRETTFSVADLEELIFLLADNPTSSATTIPRPSKVRKMFAMRACRSSIMIGKALSGRQMERVVRHMGEMEKPWNCPHGRPTMRHLCGLGAWAEGGFDEFGGGTDWAAWARERRGEE